jgi:hypothetical protein
VAFQGVIHLEVVSIHSRCSSKMADRSNRAPLSSSDMDDEDRQATSLVWQSINLVEMLFILTLNNSDVKLGMGVNSGLF